MIPKVDILCLFAVVRVCKLLKNIDIKKVNLYFRFMGSKISDSMRIDFVKRQFAKRNLVLIAYNEVGFFESL